MRLSLQNLTSRPKIKRFLRVYSSAVFFNGSAAICEQNRTRTAFALQLTHEYKKLAIFEADELV